MNLSDNIEQIPKIQKPHIAALLKLGIFTVRDLLFYFPYRYLDFSKLAKISELKPGETVTVEAAIKTIQSRFSFRSRMSLAEAIVSDDSGSIKIVWFNQGYLAETLKSGDKVLLAGTAEEYKNSLQLTNPIYEKASEFPVHTSRLVPVYRLTQKLYPRTFRNFIAHALPAAEEIVDDFPKGILERQGLMSITETIRHSHFPDDADQVQEAKKRLAFEEIFYSQLLAQKHKLEMAKKQSFAVKFDQDLVKSFIGRLPFELTPAQKKAAWDILQDLEKNAPMNRLLEGDVGSGKTLVALIAALQVMSADLQVALLAPTEILAKQHSDTAFKFLMRPPVNFNTRVSLLTRNFSQKNSKDVERKKLIKQLGEKMPGLIIGTHALLQEKIKFKNLALVIIDEQHRFGVEQRAELIKSDGKIPHLLSLSATPIPRTLQLAYYGELDISQIKQKPQGRKPILTKLVQNINRDKAYDFIRKQILGRRQIFVITPLIDESDKLGVKAATTEVKNLLAIFPQNQIGLMHGRLKGAEKEKAMADFLANRTQILVSTSVVEVGVDVPNASVMLIEGAERFGLAQLHQFRGRVGRAEHQSFCFLFTETENIESIKRLEAFTKSSDGFELAELDLKQRGFGELYGSSQSGWNFKYFSPAYTSLIEPARAEAFAILKEDLDLKSHPRLRRKIKDQVIHFE